MQDPQSIESHLPLKAAVFHILLALVENPRHGYAIMRSVQEDSGGRVRLTTGAFYRHLQKLIEDGLVSETDERPEDDDPRRGAYYTVTELGWEVLSAESRRLAELVTASTGAGLLPIEGGS